MPALRCHLMIGPPASGKTTIALALAELLGAERLSSEQIQHELYGDASIEGHGPEVEDHLHQLIQLRIAAGRSVLVDSTHAQRAKRLAITQRLEVAQPVEWIGWWVRTPREVCLNWNRQRACPAPDRSIQQCLAALGDPVFAPERAEGFATLIDFDPSLPGELSGRLQQELNRLERRISSARNKDRSKELHGYSRLLDLERLLYLLQLLSRYPGLGAGDASTRAELEAICNPLPEGGMATRAAALLGGLRGACYADSGAISADLEWLISQGFLSASVNRQTIEPPPADECKGSNNLGGWPQMGDRTVFIRVLTLLRYLLQQPFDHQPGTPLQAHLIAGLNGVYLPGEGATLRKDIERVFSPYGFRERNDNVRHGYGIGTALLSATRLREVHQVITQAVVRLGDPSAHDLLAELDERLRWGGVLPDDEPPVRILANRSIVHPELVRQDSLAVPLQAERLESAICAGQRVLLERFADGTQRGDSSSSWIRAWPLQLIFHNIGWYLAYEHDAVGRHGLIQAERLDRLALRQVDRSLFRSARERAAGIARLARLMQLSGGIYFGEEQQRQELLCAASAEQVPALLTTVRFRCSLRIYRLLREGLQRYPLTQLRLSRPLPDDRWRYPSGAPLVLQPLPETSHPFPVELDLPCWTVAADQDFRRWLFGYGDEVVIESPAALRVEHRDRAAAVAALYPA